MPCLAVRPHREGTATLLEWRPSRESALASAAASPDGNLPPNRQPIPCHPFRPSTPLALSSLLVGIPGLPVGPAAAVFGTPERWLRDEEPGRGAVPVVEAAAEPRGPRPLRALRSDLCGANVDEPIWRPIGDPEVR
jgi:hypothetical protein